MPPPLLLLLELELLVLARLQLSLALQLGRQALGVLVHVGWRLRMVLPDWQVPEDAVGHLALQAIALPKVLA